MIGTANRKKWWLPLLAIFVPGSCYLYSAVLPEYEPVFAAAALALTATSSMGFLYVVLSAPRAPTLLLQFALLLCLTLPAPLIASHVWSYLYPGLVLPAIAGTWAIFILGWVLPFILPKASNTIYKEMWYPRSLWARAVLLIFFARVGTSGVEGAMTGSDIVRTYGSRVGLIVVGVISTLTALAAPFYFSVGLWRKKRGEPQIPSPD